MSLPKDPPGFFRRHIVLIMCFFVGAILAIGDELKERQLGIHISQAEYGDRWPYTIPEGTLRCLDHRSIVLMHKGVPYALNGKATTKARVHVSGGQLTPPKYKELMLIWRDRPDYPGAKMPDPGIIDRGLALCEK